MTRDQVRWGNTLIPFTFKYVKRKTLAISVHPDLTVSIKAPDGTPIEAIREIVHKRGPWIRKAWREFELYLPKQPSRQYINGETHRYLGRQYRLRAEAGEIESVKCLRGFLLVTTIGDPSPEKTQFLIEKWLKEHAKKIFHERLSECAKKASIEGIKIPDIKIQKMKTRWGSCTRSGKIILNIDLIKAPKDCIDYVIFHELCHIKERHHGPRFWKLLSKLLPEYETRKKRLNFFADV